MARFALFAVCVAAIFVATLAQSECGGTCVVNADCEGTCQFCMGGKCGSGCAQNCTANADCLDINCPFCSGTPTNPGYCGSSPNSECGGACQVNTDCDQRPSNDCKLCLSGVCSAGCGQTCKDSAECTGPTCQSCLNGLCASANGTCLAPCTLNSDCKQTSDCNQCVQGTCGAGCNTTCEVDSQCLDSNCPYCYNGKCGGSPHATCGAQCLENSDCDQSAGNNCKLCLGGSCTAGCGQKCANSSQCAGPSCQACVNGICSAANAPCLGACVVDDDCPPSAFCKSCINKECGAGCNSKCSDDSQCLNTDCKFCSEGTCQSTPHGRTCHQSCTTNSDCDGTPGTCEYCTFGACGSPCSAPCKQNSDCITFGCNYCGGTGVCAP